VTKIWVSPWESQQEEEQALKEKKESVGNPNAFRWMPVGPPCNRKCYEAAIQSETKPTLHQEEKEQRSRIYRFDSSRWWPAEGDYGATRLVVLVPAAIAKFNEKGRDATKLKKNETVALLLSCYFVYTVAALKKEKKPFFIAKLQQEIDSDGGWWYIGWWYIGCECIGRVHWL
jgi:hypothetical protein